MAIINNKRKKNLIGIVLDKTVTDIKFDHHYTTNATAVFFYNSNNKDNKCDDDEESQNGQVSHSLGVYYVFTTQNLTLSFINFLSTWLWSWNTLITANLLLLHNNPNNYLMIQSSHVLIAHG